MSTLQIVTQEDVLIDAMLHRSGSDLFYDGFSEEECLTERQRRQWRAQRDYEVDCSDIRNEPGYCEAREFPR